MEPKAGSSAVVTAEVVREALGGRSDLSAVEEKVIRMRYGAPAGDKAPLPQAHGDREDLKDELLLLELQLLKAYRRQRAGQEAARSQVAAPPSSARVDVKAKDKIVRALRKKKDR